MDLIDRQAAIDAIDDLIAARLSWREPYQAEIKGLNAARCAIDDLPSTQPEIIYCKDCKYSSPNMVYGCRIDRFSIHDENVRLYADDFCSRAERRTDG